jgi:hypothetical protein
MESSRMLVTALLASGVGDLVDVIVPHHLLQGEVVALRQAKLPEEGDDGNSLPHKPERRLIKDGGRGLFLLDVGVLAFDQHG